MARQHDHTDEDLEEIRRLIGNTDLSAINHELRALIEMHWPSVFDKLHHRHPLSPEAQPQRVYSVGEIERQSMKVLRMIVQQARRGQKLDCALFERAKRIVECYDRVIR
jgi:hypothetical protein